MYRLTFTLNRSKKSVEAESWEQLLTNFRDTAASGTIKSVSLCAKDDKGWPDEILVDKHGYTFEQVEAIQNSGTDLKRLIESHGDSTLSEWRSIPLCDIVQEHLDTWR